MDTIFYDGQCGLCHRTVRFILRHDRHARFRFAPLQGETFARLLPVPTCLPDSVIVQHGDRLLARSAAVIHVLRQLGPGWRSLAWLAALLPPRLRDGLYDLAARLRRAGSRPPTGACPVVPPAWRHRFLP